MSVNGGALIGDLQVELSKLPKVQGSGDSMYASRRLNQLMSQAEKRTNEFKDEFISVEHLYLALLMKIPSAKLLNKYGNMKEGFQALTKVRGNQDQARIRRKTRGSERYGRDLSIWHGKAV